ncbi:MAG: lmo0937 family membrane protein [Archangium gephyra]|uniref:Lmo0937 family membrane protein n=1 Tax=Archangium gephyra TaxID=48 RepID=A0A2W5ST80_9BACT|nr:MAG: lmo0937 family membrane protein [Archangium gephyra]
MLFTFALVLILVWVWGTATSVTFGGFIHLALVLAMTVILARMFQPRRRGR